MATAPVMEGAAAPISGMLGLTAWDVALADYTEKRATERAARLAGPYRDILDAHKAAWDGVDKHKLSPEDRQRFDGSYAGVCSAEERHETELEDPAWEAAKLLFAAPAPDRAALLVKIEAIKAEDAIDEGAHHVFDDVRRLLAPTQVDGGAWEEALAAYRAKRAASDAIDVDAPGGDEAIDAYCAAMDALVEKTPAPDPAAFRLKVELTKERWADNCLPDEWLDALIADALRLMGAEG